MHVSMSLKIFTQIVKHILIDGLSNHWNINDTIDELIDVIWMMPKFILYSKSHL